jgi:PAS domain S-box-containing protein
VLPKDGAREAPFCLMMGEQYRRHHDMNSTIDCEQLVASVGDAVIASDASGAITLWNPGAVRMFGYSEEEALGKSLDLITPERLRNRHWEGYEKSMASGTTKYGNDLLRVPATHKDGRAMSIAFTVAMLFTPEHKVSAVVAVIRDETVRFNDERALKKRIAELETQLASSFKT